MVMFVTHGSFKSFSVSAVKLFNEMVSFQFVFQGI